MSTSKGRKAWPFRALLFVPAHRSDWVAKCTVYAPDAVILDLEDSVTPEQKPAAREQIPQEIDSLVSYGIAPIVRLNALEEGAEEDLRSCVKSGLVAVILPKTDGPEDIVRLDAMLGVAEAAAGMPIGNVGIVALPETARGLWMSHEIAAASTRVMGLMAPVSGPIAGDVSQAFGYQPTMDGEEQLFLQSRTILASRAAGAPYPIASIFGTRLDDLDSVERLAVRAKRLGFSGIAVIHPSHVQVVARMYRPSADEVDYARGILQALKMATAAGHGAVQYRGRMIDAAMVSHAEEVIASAE